MRTATTTPWGANGKEIKGRFKPVAQVMHEAKLDWNVSLEKLYTADGRIVPKSFATRRDDTKQILGVVGDRYKVFQNVDAFGVFDSFVQAKQASITTVGSFKEGRVLFLQAEVITDPIEIIKDDIIKSYITLGHAHDGSLAILWGFSPVRMWCLNQLPKFKRASEAKIFRLKHTKNAELGIEAIKSIMDINRQEFVASGEQLKILAGKGIRKKDIEKYVKLVFMKDEKDERDMTKTVEAIEHLFETGLGLGTKATHNYYGLFNAVTEYLTWQAGRTVDNRLPSLWFGENQRVAEKALDVALKLAV